ncbi:hypothetical protein Tco_0913673, partial [Tanacetum coccineum]
VEPNADKVFAQNTLMPKPNQDENTVKKDLAPSPEFVTVNLSLEVNAASENMLEVTTASKDQVNAGNNMDQDSAHMVAASKVPMLKPGEYEIWRMRIEQYIQMINYALWEVIENGATLPKTKIVEGVTIELPITSAEDKARRRLATKARSTLMMGIPNEHQLKFNSIKDAKKLLEAVEKRFGRNEATKKTQNNLLKQQYENFTAPSSEMLDSNFDRLQKLTRRFLKNTGRKVFEEGFDGLGGYDWSDQAEEGPNYALVAFSSSNPDLEFWSTVKAKTINVEAQLYALVNVKKIIITESYVRRDLQLADEKGVDCLPNSTIFEQLALMRKPKRKDTQVPQPSGPTKSVADEAVYKELGNSLVRAATTASSLEAEQDNGGGPKCQETMGDTIAQTRFESVSKHSNDSLLARGNILQSDEDRLKLNKLMELCTTLQNRVLDLKKTKITQHNEIASLKRRVKKLEKKSRSRTHKLKRLYKAGLTARVESFGDEECLGEDASKHGRINAIDADEEITLVNVQDDADKEMFDVDALNGEEVFVVGQNENVVEEVVAQVNTTATTITITTEEITLAQALEALKTSKPKVKGIVFQEPGKSTTTTTTISSQQSQDKGKGIMIEEPVKPMKKKDQISFDEEVALKLQAEFDEEERLAREKAEKEKEANIALIEEWDDIQAKIDADHQLAERLQAQEQEELSDAEKATLFQQLLEKRRKHFAAKRAEEKRNKPPTKAQQKKIMCTYLKNMEGYKLNDLKLKDFDSIQEMFDRAFKRVNTFEDFRTELVEGKEKRAGAELVQGSTKKQKVNDDKETTKLKQLMRIIPD